MQSLFFRGHFDLLVIAIFGSRDETVCCVGIFWLQILPVGVVMHSLKKPKRCVLPTCRCFVKPSQSGSLTVNSHSISILLLRFWLVSLLAEKNDLPHPLPLCQSIVCVCLCLCRDSSSRWLIYLLPPPAHFALIHTKVYACNGQQCGSFFVGSCCC